MNCKTDRDRLIELFHKAEDICDRTLDCDTCKYVLSGSCKTVLIADYLLANGVISPPCKVGDKTFLLLEKVCGGYDIVESYCARILDNGNGKIYSMFYDFGQIEIGNSLEFRICDFGKTVFLTKEEAEEKLKELGKDV